NVYTGSHELELGWAAGAWTYQNVPDFDGAVISSQTMPGGALWFPDPNEPDGELHYDSGDTLIHEVGHWLGLYHTFQFQPGQAGVGPNVGCSIDNDLVEDTPAEAGVTYYCTPRDSCTGDFFEGEDDIDNFMAYVDDDCMGSFTSGQEQRMDDHWEAYRAP
ncbi:MAG: M43 family zinc metalloprotease, partial [Myxococcota bacterium]